MADDPERDLIPTKDVRSFYSNSDIHIPDRHTTSELRTAVQLSRNDLEDQFYRFKEENFQLKKAAKKQEDDLKKLATKMTRLLREKKKMESSSSPGHKRDLELEEMVEDLQDKVRTLEKTNAHLREKILVAKQQVITQIRRPYSHVPPKVNSGRPRSGSSPYLSSVSLKGKGPQANFKKPPMTSITPYALTLLDDARNELSNLKMQVSSQKAEIDIYEQENEVLKQRLRMKEIEFEDELNILKSQITQRQRQHVQENLDLIRLHRELKQKTTKIITVQAQYSEVEEKMKMLKLNHDHLVKDMEELTSRLKKEQKKNLELIGELQKRDASIALSSEFQENVKCLQKENDVLRETNEKLIRSALNIEREKTDNQIEQILREKVSSLEEKLSEENNAKSSLQDELVKERVNNEKQHGELITLQETCTEMRTSLEDLESKLNFLKRQDVDFDELGEALTLIKLKKQKSIKLSFLNEVPEEESEDLTVRLKKSESDHIETIKELASVREMLMTQYKINKEAQEEIRILTEKMEQKEKEYQTKLEEYAYLLDIRAARIQKLERQLNDIAYGTKKFKIPDSDLLELPSEPVELSRGENLFEMHISKVVLSNEGLSKFQDNNPSTFVTWTFFEFELQSTPISKGPRPHFNSIAQYYVQVDDFFLYYLHNNTTTLELHESLGTDYKTVAACQLNFSDVIDQSNGRLHGTQPLIGIEDKSITYGSVEYWVRFQVPMEEAFKLYKEKFKALKYIHTNKDKSTSALNLLRQPYGKEENKNELHIKISRCLNLQSNQKDAQPSAFCVYKFYDFPDQDSAIIPASNNPEFSDHHTFSLYMDSDVDKYLKSENLVVYVFDDNESELTSHIGKASIPLLPLSQNQPVKGIFELHKQNEKSSQGAVEVSIYWQSDYMLSIDRNGFPESADELIEYPPHIQPVVSISSDSDEEFTPQHPTPQDYSVMPPPVPKPRSRGLSKKTTSTPIKERSESSSASSGPEKPLADQSLSLSSVHAEEEIPMDPVPPKPAARKSKTPLDTVDDFIEYGKSILSESAHETEIKSSPSITKVKQSGTHEEEESDVMLDRKQEMSFEEISDEDKQALSEGESNFLDSEEESEDDFSDMVPTVTVYISHLVFSPDASLLKDSTQKVIYIDYEFLDFPIDDLETPVSLPIAPPPGKLVFDFRKGKSNLVIIDEHGYLKDFLLSPEIDERWRLLAKMFDSENLYSSCIKFAVVSEPIDEKDIQCDEVGYAFLDLREVLIQQKDIIQKPIPVYDAQESETVIGELVISIKALSVLLQLQERFSIKCQAGM